MNDVMNRPDTDTLPPLPPLPRKASVSRRFAAVLAAATLLLGLGVGLANAKTKTVTNTVNHTVTVPGPATNTAPAACAAALQDAVTDDTMLRQGFKDLAAGNTAAMVKHLTAANAAADQYNIDSVGCQ